VPSQVTDALEAYLKKFDLDTEVRAKEFLELEGIKESILNFLTDIVIFDPDDPDRRSAFGFHPLSEHSEDFVVPFGTLVTDRLIDAFREAWTQSKKRPP
jgi:hypothetical protein